ncbi:YihY/virulence factor BrkB family protein [Winogradskyella bathintestinalis]|uniref:YihY/virulence factor BrkB family protein n=1 Tax=Winogradskyella bathintestinalis TaxID=3035208 RepID=A0ABT7ZY18_9FLAO|nr:YihY/virulence factor BrkB family protein [Winogradskyella bathintestinalis]MDN3493796.1 YihY/virulence factor BrkB family protein [Winogradskyella bathintestinalis]
MSDTIKFKIQHLPKLLLETGKAWFAGEPFQRSAIVAYYAILSLPALIIIILKVVGSFWGEDIVQGQLLSEISAAIGPEAAEAIRTMIVNQSGETTSIFATVIGIGTLLYGSTGVFFQLQSALDHIWEQEPAYENDILATVMSRVKSFGFILILGFLLLTSFILTSLLSTFSSQLNRFLPENMFDYLFIIDFLVSVGFIYILFATMFKYLPSAKVSWKSVRVGAALTTIMFMIGKYLLALYFNTMEPGSTYGAAGSIILIMLWVSYSSLILLYGAYFTKQYANKYIEDDHIT